MAVRSTILALLFAIASVPGCDSVDEKTREEARKAGINAQGAEELAKMEMTPEEMTAIGRAKKAGVDDASIMKMVKALHKADLRFDIGVDLELLVGQGVNATTLTQLVELGAIPRMTDDIRALKESGVGEVALVEIAKIRFEKKKDILSGSEYARLRSAGLSDVGLLTFVRNGGNAQQLQSIARDLALGKSEQEALKGAGM